ncbi:MAG TPA: hypothetical protein VNJ04_20245 [Gemmatimonadaceae bacterium]|nr:hypothetical protein [Gemmatimonadaceae bacterium]
MRGISRLFAVAAVVAVSACDSSTAPDSAQLTRAEAEQLATDTEALTSFTPGPSFPSFSLSAGGDAQQSVPTPINNAFTYTRACPKGGNVTVAGTMTGSADRATQDISVASTATRTDANCAFQTRDGVLTLNGNPNVVVKSTTSIVAGKPAGLQTSSQKGAFTWTRSTGGSGSCLVDITSSVDPATSTVTVVGSYCGHAVNVTRALERRR